MKINLSRLILACLLLAGRAYGNLPEDSSEYAAWEVRSLEKIESQAKQTPENAIPKLGDWVGRLSKGANIEPGDRPVFHAAQTLLLAIPGHATYYQEKIEALHAEVLANSKIPEAEIDKMQQAGRQPINAGDYDDFRNQAFGVLGLLPSCEAVAVLGHYLNDPEGRDHKDLLGHIIPEPSDYSPTPLNAEYAAKAIRKLGIEHPPFRVTQTSTEYNWVGDGEVDAWKAWWNEVKAGKRTYRFIGSLIEYCPDGPASKDASQRAERNHEREGGRKKTSSGPENGSSVSPVSQPLTIAGILAGCAFLAAAVWYFIKGRKTA